SPGRQLLPASFSGLAQAELFSFWASAARLARHKSCIASARGCIAIFRAPPPRISSLGRGLSGCALWTARRTHRIGRLDFRHHRSARGRVTSRKLASLAEGVTRTQPACAVSFLYLLPVGASQQRNRDSFPRNSLSLRHRRR